MGKINWKKVIEGICLLLIMSAYVEGWRLIVLGYLLGSIINIKKDDNI